MSSAASRREVPWAIFIAFCGEDEATSLESNGKNPAMRPGNSQVFPVGSSGCEWDACGVNTVTKNL